MKFDTLVDSVPLMRQLAKMGNIPESWCKRMVLVLDVDDSPRLYIETFLDAKNSKGVALVPTQLLVEEQPMTVDTTVMQKHTRR